MAGVARGEQPALERVYELTSAKLLGVILRITRDREVAEDVLQETYIKLWHRAGRYDPARGSPITWLCTIARNGAIDTMRRKGARSAWIDRETIEEIEDDAERADDMLCNVEERERVQRCIDALQDDHRRSIRMAFFDGLTHTELAERIGVPLGTMKSWIRRGLASLKGCLADG